VDDVRVSPVPTRVDVGVAEIQGQDKMVALIITTPVGTSTYFVPPEGADKVAEMLQESAVKARTKLEIAHDLPRNGQRRQ
jgi:hypothetical protein